MFPDSAATGPGSARKMSLAKFRVAILALAAIAIVVMVVRTATQNQHDYTTTNNHYQPTDTASSDVSIPPTEFESNTTKTDDTGVTTTVTTRPSPHKSTGTPRSARPVTVGSKQPVGGPGGNWTSSFSEEFDAPRIDTSKWQTGWFGDKITSPVNKLEKNCYDSKHTSVANGIATFAGQPQQSTCEGKTFPNTTSLISSNGKFAQGYGYFEARISMPPGTRTWPGWWLNKEPWPQSMEIDIVEGEGNGKDTGGFNVHYSCPSGVCNMNGGDRVVTVPGATSGFHTYAADVQATGVTFYYDGKQVGKYAGAVPNVQRYLIMGLGTMDGALPGPTQMKVDYIRAWRR